jgi:hypothetical protein
MNPAVLRLAAPGVIVGVRSISRGADSNLAYFPTVKFTTADGRHIEAERRPGSTVPPGRAGNFVTVYYDPADPRQFTLDSIARVTGWAGQAFIVMGVLVLLLAVALLIVAAA